MKVNDIYMNVLAHGECDLAKFMIYLNETIDEINLIYPIMGEIEHANDEKGEVDLEYKFMMPVVDNILFLMGLGDKYKSEFLRKSKYAFCFWWREKNSLSARIKRGVY